MKIPATTAARYNKQGYCPWPRKIQDGRSSHPLYKTWENMISRCHNKNATRYDRYGGRGIDGIDGTNGRDGEDGADGSDGINGTNGRDGIDGQDGKDGADSGAVYIGEYCQRVVLDLFGTYYISNNSLDILTSEWYKVSRKCQVRVIDGQIETKER